jgi:hypothetical protein
VTWRLGGVTSCIGANCPNGSGVTGETISGGSLIAENGLAVTNGLTADTITTTGALTVASVTTTGQSVFNNAYRFYAGGSDGSAAYTDFRTNTTTGNAIISAKSSGLMFNYDHGTNGVLDCNGSAICNSGQTPGGVTWTVDGGSFGFTGPVTGGAFPTGFDTQISRPSAGVLSMDTSAAGNAGATVNMGGLAVGGGTTIAKIAMYSTASISPSAVSAQSCSDQTFTVTGLTVSDRLGTMTPPAALGNVSVNAYANASNTLELHFCNPSASSVTPPAGVYSFLAMH